ncbi:MAG: phosphate transport system substrate-binding protein [Planctomycetota bacterium]|jgi:phosphate transport system substrate-binding protein
MRIRLPAALAILLLSLLSSCAGDTAAAGKVSGNLTVTGSSTVAPLIAEIALRFEAQHPGARIDVQAGGSSRGLHDVQAGLADVGMMSRELKDSETGEVQAHTIARDGVALILHASNPVSALDADQVRAIYRGEVTDWSELGGAAGEITVINKASGRATLEVFLDHYGLSEGEIKADLIIGDNQQGLKAVAGSPLAIGYVSIGAAEYEIEAGAALQLLPSDGIAASVASVATGRFPISRPLNLITVGEPEGLARAFIDFCRSTAVHDLVADLRFSPAQSMAGSASQAVVDSSNAGTR